MGVQKRGCPRCAGDVLRTGDASKEELSCLQCGWYHEGHIGEPQPMPQRYAPDGPAQGVNKFPDGRTVMVQARYETVGHLLYEVGMAANTVMATVGIVNSAMWRHAAVWREQHDLLPRQRRVAAGH